MPLILGTNSIKDTGYDVANSLRFDDGSSDNIQRTYGTPTNSKIFGLSWWVKLGKAFDGSGSQDLWGERTDSNNRVFMGINSTGQFDFFEKNSGSNVVELKTNRLFRDNSAWYHFLLLGDSTQGTASNRIKLYVNGVQETSFATETYPSSDYAFRLALNTVKYFGRVGLGGSLSTNYYDGYLAEAVFVDGTVTAHTDYGEFDEDSPTIWKPKDVSGLTFGNNGFYLDFEDSSALGNDVSGNNNDFTVNNLTSVDQSLDVCTNNYCTANSMENFYAQSTFNNANLQVISTTTNAAYNKGTFGVSKGKWYYEVKIVDSSSNGTIGVGWIASSPTSTTDQMKNKTNQSTYRDNGTIFGNGSEIVTGSSLANNDIVGVYFDADNNFVYYAKNGDLQNSGNPTSGSSGTGGFDPGAVATATDEGFYFPAFGDHSGGQNVGIEFNFGSPSYAISSGNSDADGHGNFEYSVPSGYFTLCTKNLAEYG